MSLTAHESDRTLMLQFSPGALVVEAEEGVFRTVAALKDHNQWWVVLAPDNPLCHLLSRTPQARVMEANGAAFHVHARDASDEALAEHVVALVAQRLSAACRASNPRLYRLVPHAAAAPELPSDHPLT